MYVDHYKKIMHYHFSACGKQQTRELPAKNIRSVIIAQVHTIKAASIGRNLILAQLKQ